MKPSSQRALSFMISLVFLVSAVLVYGLLISPAYQNVQILRGQLALKNAELTQQDQSVKDLSTLLQQFHDLTSAQQLLELSLPNDAYISQIVNTLNGLAVLNSLTLKSVSIQISPLQFLGNPSYVQNIGSARTHFQATGTYENFKTFIGQIERNVRIMDAISLQISPGRSASTSTTVTIIRSGKTTAIPPTPSQFVLTFDVDLQAYFQEPAAPKNATSTRG